MPVEGGSIVPRLSWDGSNKNRLRERNATAGIVTTQWEVVIAPQEGQCAFTELAVCDKLRPVYRRDALGECLSGKAILRAGLWNHA